ncbi:sigma-70 family RNA polymerase sigma factor [Nonomuraea ceibae]|uniref:sigma-70 family RNA polymerase sigma factor n=1 Tax=Nonomuraea ceibae TaxID=1935170 RepID=UPI0027DEBD7B|nr:sigma-70 family RNA polymerase sigma factor [Nonomuraea ceibae]
MPLALEASTANRTLSLDAPAKSDESASLGDLLPEHDESLTMLIDPHAVKPLIDALPHREKKILLMRFYGNMTQAEIAAELGISQIHVSRIVRAVLTQQRKQLST